MHSGAARPPGQPLQRGRQQMESHNHKQLQNKAVKSRPFRYAVRFLTRNLNWTALGIVGILLISVEFFF